MLLNKLNLIFLSGIFAANVGAKNSSYSQPPTSHQWQAFMTQDSAQLRQRWQQNPVLKEFHWQWRLGWLHHCSKSSRSHEKCPEIISQGLLDRSALVRAAAVPLVPLYFETQKARILLKKAAEHPRNSFPTAEVVRKRIHLALDQL